MFGPGAHNLTIELNPDYPGFLLAVLPPGAFFGLALLIVAKNWFDLRPAQKTAPATTLPESA
jgi:electron transport complex protein RnfE